MVRFGLSGICLTFLVFEVRFSAVLIHLGMAVDGLLSINVLFILKYIYINYFVLIFLQLKVVFII